MDKVHSTKYANLIMRDRNILIIDNKDNRRITTINSGKLKISKKDVNLKFFEMKSLNTFWDLEETDYKQITHKEFFSENMRNL
jgi:hypothetical protein